MENSYNANVGLHALADAAAELVGRLGPRPARHDLGAETPLRLPRRSSRRSMGSEPRQTSDSWWRRCHNLSHQTSRIFTRQMSSLARRIDRIERQG